MQSVGSTAAPVFAGLIVGIGLIIVFAVSSLYSIEHYGPPTMEMVVDGKEHKTGHGSFTGSLPFGRGFGADVDSSRTLPKEIVNVTRGSVITFSFGELTLARQLELREAWVREPSLHDQYFLENTRLNVFTLGPDIPNGEYILTVRGSWVVNGYGQGGHFNSQIRVQS